MNAIETILASVKEQNESLYQEAMKELYELKNGKHFDEKRGREAVAAMYSTDTSGAEFHGEHFTREDANREMAEWSESLGDNDTCFDVYVILNAWWHDLRCNHTDDKVLIRDAMTWAFLDDDAPEGKVWRYMQSMKD